jgi:hypothetical protein
MTLKELNQYRKENEAVHVQLLILLRKLKNSKYYVYIKNPDFEMLVDKLLIVFMGKHCFIEYSRQSQQWIISVFTNEKYLDYSTTIVLQSDKLDVLNDGLPFTEETIFEILAKNCKTSEFIKHTNYWEYTRWITRLRKKTDYTPFKTIDLL